MPKVNFETGSAAVIDTLPDECPFCKYKIAPIVAYGGHSVQRGMARVIMFCNNEKCKEAFIAYYSIDPRTAHTAYVKTSIGKSAIRTFPDSIRKISIDFVDIYNQSFGAEQIGLKQVCGVGYRKSIEFLIKDFSKSKEKDSEDNQRKIEAMPLMQVIKTYIDHPRIKSNSERAVWLGNDETHYVRKWEDKDLKDLKILIDLTVSYIDTEYLSDAFAEEMKS